ncbi:hypothetical protein EX30DRAFT_61762 [Ascodesmis nigricans]|uniref:Uncharacterized protein n=1 Tax=Ascodesmis nigricans TaxID=341454 RepID=A0A4S2MUD7_9PEZI|nr:hypothetical protein EX30DRAFT_61762 [Ascodesmis nigricans]
MIHRHLSGFRVISSVYWFGFLSALSYYGTLVSLEHWFWVNIAAHVVFYCIVFIGGFALHCTGFELVGLAGTGMRGAGRHFVERMGRGAERYHEAGIGGDGYGTTTR